MENEQQPTEKISTRKEKIKNWLKKPENLAILGILLFGFFIRLYYFNLTKLQPLWWDEAAYGSLAKNYIYGRWDALLGRETLIRAPFFPLLWSLLMRMGLDEIGSRFLLLFIPSVFSGLFIYLIGKEMYNKKAGLISAFIFSVLWIHLFYSSRLLTDVPSLSFLLLSAYFFIKGMRNEFIGKYFTISLFALGISTLLRYPNGLVFFVYLGFILITGKFKLVKNHKFWLFGIAGISPLLLFFLINLITKGSIFPALLSGQAAAPSAKIIGWNVLNYIPIYLKTPFFVFFIVGFIIAIFEIFIGYDQIFKNGRIKSNLFAILFSAVLFSYFIFYIRAAEDRWLLGAHTGVIILAGMGLAYTADYLKKYWKYLGVILILVVFALGAYQQLTFAELLIKEKKESFLQIREGLEWLGATNQKEGSILASSLSVYTIYYSEMNYNDLPSNISGSEELNNLGADYLVLHAFRPQKDYIDKYIRDNQDKWRPVQAFFFDKEKKQAAFIIYKNMKSGDLR